MKRYIRRIIVFALFLPLILEVSVRLFLPQQLLRLDNYFVSDDGLGRVPAPNMDTRVNTGEGEVRYITNERGDRIGHESSGTASLRILALGDSFLQALQVNYEETMTARTESLLAMSLGKTVKIDNTGSANFDSPQYSILMQRRLAQEDYDMVLVFFYSGNDFVEERRDYYEAQKPSQRVFRFPPQALTWNAIRRDILIPAADFLESQSHFFSLIKLQSSSLMNRLGVTGHSLPAPLLRKSAASKMWSVTGAILNDIKQEGTKHNIPVIIVLLPTIYAVELDKLSALIDQYGLTVDDIDLQQPSRAMISYAQQYGLDIVDLTGAFRESYLANHSRLFGRVDSHFTPAGHELAANTLTPYLLTILKGQH
ncbi:MAG: hypothetical protein IAE83_21455 [Anaerolinea sp.]|nr:hypothetical protein [Anaerolinea sp.]